MIERLANLADRPFRGHPGLNGFLISVGLLVLYVILMPPLFWLIGRLFAPALEPLGHVAMWWWKLWN